MHSHSNVNVIVSDCKLRDRWQITFVTFNPPTFPVLNGQDQAGWNPKQN